MTQITGFKSTDIESRTTVTPTTVNPVQHKRQGPDTISWTSAYEVTSGTLASGSTTTTLSITGIEASARPGDIILLQSRVLSVTAVSTNTLTIGQLLATAPSAGEAFSLRRYLPPKTDSSGVIEVQGAGLPSGNFIEDSFTLNAVAQTASPTALPSNGYSTAFLYMREGGAPFSGASTVAFEFSPDNGVNYYPAWITARFPVDGEFVAEISTASFLAGSGTDALIGAVNLLQYPLFRVRVTASVGGSSLSVQFRSQPQVNFDSLPRTDNALATEVTLLALSDKLQTAASSTKTLTGQLRMGAEYNASVTTDATNGQIGTIRMSQARSAHVEIRSGTSAVSVATETTLASLNTKVTACNTNDVTITNIPGGATSVVTQVAASASSVTLLAANADRKEAEFYNDSSYVCYLKKGSSAATISYTAQVLPGGYYKINPGDYSGIVTGIWPVASGNMLVTEVEA
jgi:hypothetical protein